jgi:hypothetical protein
MLEKVGEVVGEGCVTLSRGMRIFDVDGVFSVLFFEELIREGYMNGFLRWMFERGFIVLRG